MSVETSASIRKAFVSFFESKGHRFVRSSPVFPQDDPTLLFTNAGMNQFKDVFLGKGARDYTRAVNSQKCIRASGKHNDLEDVGRDNFHHTFFEMLGNWSFGDYFKHEAITWAWELLVDVWGLPADRLYATVFAGDPDDGLEPDEEAERIWSGEVGVPPERVLRFDKKDNFWEMGDVGPCGPCSEIHIDLGEGKCPLAGVKGHTCAVNTDGCWRFVELWNLVFIQFDRQPDGHLEALPARHVDTGMGLERITRVLQGVAGNYETDLFVPLMKAISEITGFEDPDAPGEVGVAFRVIADHLRALSFAIADGALPSNEGRGYVLRRMLRRAARFGRVLNMGEPFIHRLVPTLSEVMGEAFPELPAQQDHVMRVIRAEEESFAQTLDRGLDLFERIVQHSASSGQKVFPGHEAFKLYDTFGFPVDLTRLMAEERGMEVDMTTFDRLMEQQRQQAKAAGQAARQSVAWHEVTAGPHSAFRGYETLSLETVVRRYGRRDDGKLLLILEQTPFYPEGGGQVGDVGVIRGPAGEWRVEDTQKDGDHIVHVCSGEATPDDRPVTAQVDAHRRQRTTLNHTATHLMHAALRRVLGDHVTQAGSVVHPDYLRFDYTHFERPTEAQLAEIERQVNEVIRQNKPLDIHHTGYDEAMRSGIVALFGEKYGDEVRVVQVPDFSAELCGGCHVRATGDIGTFKIVSESSIAAGVRRILALTGEAAERHLAETHRLVEQLKQQLGAGAGDLAGRVEQLMDERRRLEREVKTLKRQQLSGGIDRLLEEARPVNGIQVVAGQVEAESMEELRGLADTLRKKMRNSVAVIGSVIKGKGSLLCVVSEDLVRQNIKAGEIVNQVAHLAGGRGGGPPHMATAGAKDVSKLPLAVQQAPDVIDAYLAERSA